VVPFLVPHPKVLCYNLALIHSSEQWQALPAMKPTQLLKD